MTAVMAAMPLQTLVMAAKTEEKTVDQLKDTPEVWDLFHIRKILARTEETASTILALEVAVLLTETRAATQVDQPVLFACLIYQGCKTHRATRKNRTQAAVFKNDIIIGVRIRTLVDQRRYPIGLRCPLCQGVRGIAKCGNTHKRCKGFIVM